MDGHFSPWTSIRSQDCSSAFGKKNDQAKPKKFFFETNKHVASAHTSYCNTHQMCLVRNDNSESIGCSTVVLLLLDQTVLQLVIAFKFGNYDCKHHETLYFTRSENFTRNEYFIRNLHRLHICLFRLSEHLLSTCRNRSLV